MAANILITGGAGFIGSHLTDDLLAQGHRVRILDSLCPQVHGGREGRPAYLAEEAELMVGDVRDPEVVRPALRGADPFSHRRPRCFDGGRTGLAEGHEEPEARDHDAEVRRALAHRGLTV